MSLAVNAQIPTNPTLRVCDVAAISALAHASGALVVVDSTWLTPVLCRPFELGADFVLHSATKYMGGHSGAAKHACGRVQNAPAGPYV